MKHKLGFLVFASIVFTMFASPAFALRSSETTAAKKVMAESMAVLEKRDFDALESNLDAFLKNKDRIDDGQWKFHIAMDGISGNAAQFNEDSATVEKLYSLIKEWVKEQPESVMAKTALVHATLSRAWLYRGMKVANDTSDQQISSFEKELQEAYRSLAGFKDDESANPEFYMAWLSFAVGAGVPAELTEAIYSKAIKEYPEYFYITLQYLVGKSERWSGDPNALPEALKRHAGNPELLARAMWHLVTYRENMDLQDSVSNQPVKEGFRILREKFNSPITANQVGFLACFKWHDAPAVEDAAAAIGNQPDLTIWIKSDNYNNCINWARNCRIEKVKAGEH